MQVTAGFSKWRQSRGCCGWCRVRNCFKELFFRGDTAPTEASITIYLIAYSLWLIIGGPGSWDDVEYAHAARRAPLWVWTYGLLTIGTMQLVSLFSLYPLTMASRAFRFVATVITSSVLSYMAFVHLIARAHSPHFLFYSGLALGGWWIVMRTRDIRE